MAPTVSGEPDPILAASGRRLQRARARLQMLVEEAKTALRAGREDVARVALQRRRMTISEIELLERRLAELRDEALRVTARADAVDRLVSASLAELPAHFSAPAGRHRLRVGDAEVERQLWRLLQEDEEARA
jgi:hypothetical protein